MEELDKTTGRLSAQRDEELPDGQQRGLITKISCSSIAKGWRAVDVLASCKITNSLDMNHERGDSPLCV